VNVFFDNCTAPVFAAVLDAFFRETRAAHRAFHIRDVPGLPRGRATADVDWIAHLRMSPDTWIFLTGDPKMRRNPAERAAIASEQMHGFVLEKAYQKSPAHQVCAALIWKWPEVEQICHLLQPPSIHEVPIGRMTKLRQLRG